MKSTNKKKKKGMYRFRLLRLLAMHALRQLRFYLSVQSRLLEVLRLCKMRKNVARDDDD